MNFKTLKPHKALSSYINYYWFLEVNKSNNIFSKEFLTEGFEFSFNFGDPVEISTKNTTFKTVNETSVSGPLTSPMIVTAEGNVNIFGVCFKPGGAYPFFKYPAHELTNRLVDIRDLWGGNCLDYNSLRSLTIENRVEYLNNLFLKMIKKKKDEYINQAIQTIELYKGIITVEILAEYLDVSVRQLERKFKERVGLTPKQLLRSVRFKNAISSVVMNPEIAWADTALKSGYYDQSHMVNEFKYYTGESPSVYFKNLGDPFSSLLMEIPY
ncbi:MAG: AraC family transcriptional regulator [Desulfobacterales bacterium]|nr:AraC family transcriptional regulator [Desulfobacterales bacterium]MCP4162232.1 AraC family transcriptional regulator [Deltaproteobacteria bacterium]